ncbi:MAG: glycosyl hydrolase family 28 protein, partial [Tepidisphaeraceae bacterium]
MSLVQGVGGGNGAGTRGKAKPGSQPNPSSESRPRAVVAPVSLAIAPVSRSTAKDLPPPFRIPRLREPKFPRRVIDIRDYGAVGDGRIDCTVSFADAIAACAKAGGGRVLVPAGTWSTGPIHLRSNINLHFEQGATVKFSSDPGQYLPPVFVRWGGQECYNYSPLIYARDCNNIAITGPGVLLGQGKPWWSWEKREHQTATKLYQMVLSGIDAVERIFGCEDLPLRPQMILPLNCTNVLLEDFTIAESPPFWCVHVAYCQNVIVRRVTINAADGPNNDGIIIDSSKNVIVEDCDIHVHDDCIALKSGLNED